MVTGQTKNKFQIDRMLVYVPFSTVLVKGGVNFFTAGLSSRVDMGGGVKKNWGGGLLRATDT